MPDTGAPWNIPYVAGTDLVSDWPTDSLALANAIDGGLDTLLAGGIGSNVVQTVKTDTFSTSSSSPVDVTNLSVSITPSSATSKVLLIAAISAGHSFTGGAHIALTITGGNTASYTGGTAGNRTTVALGHGGTNLEDFTRNPFSHTLAYLDSPASATAQTYQVQLQTDGGTAYINRGSDDTDVAATLRTASTLIAIEVAA